MSVFLTHLTTFGQQHASGPALIAQHLIQLVVPQFNNLAASFFLGWGVTLLIILTIIQIGGSIWGNWRYRQQMRQARQRQFEAQRQLDTHIDELVHSQRAIQPEVFLRLRAQHQLPEFQGVYVLHNQNTERNYVGQSIHVIDRVYQHFNGHGSPDVYVDYQNGQPFLIYLIPLEQSHFPSLNALEKAVIHRYHAYTNGYNKTRGNG